MDFKQVQRVVCNDFNRHTVQPRGRLLLTQ
jgi:hypothetical protein